MGQRNYTRQLVQPGQRRPEDIIEPLNLVPAGEARMSALFETRGQTSPGRKEAPVVSDSIAAAQRQLLASFLK